MSKFKVSPWQIGKVSDSLVKRLNVLESLRKILNYSESPLQIKKVFQAFCQIVYVQVSLELMEKIPDHLRHKENFPHVHSQIAKLQEPLGQMTNIHECPDELGNV